MIQLKINQQTQTQDKLTALEDKLSIKKLFKLLNVYRSMEHSMCEIGKDEYDNVSPNDASVLTEYHSEHIKNIRTKLKGYNKQSKSKSIELYINKQYKFYEEEICNETGLTKYNRTATIVEPKHTYSFKDYNELKSNLPNWKEGLKEDIRGYRKKRQSIPFIEKTLTSKVNSKFNVKYKVYAGGGYGSGENNYSIHLEKGTFVKLLGRAKIEQCFKDKRPTTNDNYVGLELEFVCKKDKSDLAMMMVEKDLQTYVCIKDDGSLRAEPEYPFTHEVVILVKESEVDGVLKRVTQVLDEAGSIVNKRCGFHVHLDMRNRDVKKSFNNLQKSQNILFAMNPSSRYKKEHAEGMSVWSKKIDTSDFDAARQLVGDDRYYGINTCSINKYNTIEIRIHSGTTNYEKIVNWVKILTSIVNHPETFTDTKIKAVTFCNRLNLDEDMVKYIESRIKKFLDDKGQHITVLEAS